MILFYLYFEIVLKQKEVPIRIYYENAIVYPQAEFCACIYV